MSRWIWPETSGCSNQQNGMTFSWHRNVPMSTELHATFSDEHMRASTELDYSTWLHSHVALERPSAIRRVRKMPLRCKQPQDIPRSNVQSIFDNAARAARHRKGIQELSHYFDDPDRP